MFFYRNLAMLFNVVLFFSLCLIIGADNNMSMTNASVKPPVFTPPSNSSSKKPFQDEFDILPTQYYADVAPMVDSKAVRVQVSLIVLNIKLSQASTQVRRICFNSFFS